MRSPGKTLMFPVVLTICIIGGIVMYVIMMIANIPVVVHATIKLLHKLYNEDTK